MRKILTPIAEICFENKTRILHIRVHEGAEMNLMNTHLHFQAINKLVKNGKYLALVDASKFYTIEKEAWQYASSKEVISNRVAAAHYNSSTPNKLAINFYLNLFDSLVPPKLFKSKREANTWLRSIPIIEN